MDYRKIDDISIRAMANKIAEVISHEQGFAYGDKACCAAIVEMVIEEFIESTPSLKEDK